MCIDPQPRRFAHWARAVALAMLGCCTLPSWAVSVLQSPVSVSLISPGGIIGDSTPISFVDVVVNDLALGIVAGDVTSIGNFMLPGEEIRFDGSSILLRVAAGGVNGSGSLVSGYLGSGVDHARYEFGGLQIAGENIVSLQVYAFDGYATSGVSGVVTGVGASLLAPDRVAFTLDDLVFVDRGGGTSGAFGEFRIDLVTTPVPEPATAVLLLAGAACLLVAGRRRSAKTI